MAAARVRTTLALPADLLAAVDEAVCAGATRSRNQFVVEALAHELQARRRAEIDASFAGMWESPEERDETEAIMSEFSNRHARPAGPGIAELDCLQRTLDSADAVC